MRTNLTLLVALLLVVSGCAGMGVKKKTLLRADVFIQAAEQDLAAARAAQADKFAADLFQRAQIDLGAAQLARQEQRGKAPAKLEPGRVVRDIFSLTSMNAWHRGG